VKHEHGADSTEKSLKGWFPRGMRIDTTLDCVELTEETLQGEVLYI